MCYLRFFTVLLLILISAISRAQGQESLYILVNASLDFQMKNDNSFSVQQGKEVYSTSYRIIFYPIENRKEAYRFISFEFVELKGQSQILKESDLSQYQIHTVKELEGAYREGYNYEKLIGLIMDKSQEQKLYMLELINPSKKLYKMSKVVIVDGSR